MFKYSRDHTFHRMDDLNDLVKFDQQIFKYYYRKIRDYHNAGGVFNENNELYTDFCNYFEVMI